jgi:dolichol-phosphate mannosyltransferase
LAARVREEPRTIASWGRSISAFSTFWIEGDLLPTPLISVVIPARDEEGRIGSAVAAVHSSLINGGFNPEIVVVDDGSCDETGQEAIQASPGRTVRLLTHAHPQGKGAAIASGLRVSAGELVGFIDADLEYPAEALPQMAQMIYETGRETACVVAVRTRDERHKLDSVTSQVGRWVARLLLQLGVSDTQAGLKMFPGWFARDVLSTAKEARWLFDVEALVLAAEHKLAILEIPVVQRCVRRRRTGVVDMIECTLPLIRYAARRHSSRRQLRRTAPS